MNISEKYEPYVFLCVYLVSCYSFCWGLMVWRQAVGGSFQNELQVLVLLPIIYSAYKHYPRFVHLLALFFASFVCVYFRVAMGSAMDVAARTIVAVSLVSGLSIEMLHYAIRMRMRLESTLKNLKKVHEALVEEKNNYKELAIERKQLKIQLNYAQAQIDSLKLQPEMQDINSVAKE